MPAGTGFMVDHGALEMSTPMSTPAPPPGHSDAELATFDVPLLLRFGLANEGPHRAARFGEGAVAAAIQADRLSVLPRSLTYLAEVARAGGIRYAAGLPEPLPGTAATSLAKDWLEAAVASMGSAGVDGDALVARWLDAVAQIVGPRLDSRVAGGRP